MFHRIDDPGGLDPRRLVNLAVRLPAYQGITAARARLEQQDTGADPFAATDGVRFVDSDSGALAADPVFGDWMDVTVVGGEG